jgi:hypothetical protein
VDIGCRTKILTLVFFPFSQLDPLVVDSFLRKIQETRRITFIETIHQQSAGAKVPKTQGSSWETTEETGGKGREVEDGRAKVWYLS